MPDAYTPGLHLLGELHTTQTELLRTSDGFRAIIEAAIAEFDLTAHPGYRFPEMLYILHILFQQVQNQAQSCFLSNARQP